MVRLASIPPLLAAAVLLGCGAAERPLADGGPHLRVLGTAQDGGFPHVACDCPRCEAATRDPSLARSVASLALIEPGIGTIVIDAGPDLPRQIEALRDVRRGAGRGGVDRSPVDGIVITHAHLGHYTGLAHLGFEAVHATGVPVHCTPAMANFLERNAPWDQLVRLENVRLLPAEPGRPFRPLETVAVTLIRVPHRDEYADTVAVRFDGPSRTVLYVPDTDGWELWDPPLEEILRDVDLAILDATFYSRDELPGRRASSIGHPPVVETVERLRDRVREGSLSVAFTHFNHSNPVLDPDSPERRAVIDLGFRILEDGEAIPLDGRAPRR